MAIAGTTSTIADLPAEGLPLREALKLSPFWLEYRDAEILRIRIHAGIIPTVGLNSAVAWQAARSQLIEWLYQQLETGVWILKAYRSEKLWGEPESFDSAVARYLSFDTDHQTVRGPNEQMFFGPRIYSTTMVPKVKEPLLVKHDGPIEMVNKRKTGRIGAPLRYDNWAIRNVARDVIKLGVPDSQAGFFKKVQDECDKRRIRYPETTRFREIVLPIYLKAQGKKVR